MSREVFSKKVFFVLVLKYDLISSIEFSANFSKLNNIIALYMLVILRLFDELER